MLLILLYSLITILILSVFLLGGVGLYYHLTEKQDSSRDNENSEDM